MSAITPLLNEHSVTSCPCGSGKSYASCCAPLHYAHAIAPSALILMKSRYCAYAVGGQGLYLKKTWAPEAPEISGLTEEQLSTREVEWKRLEVLNTKEHESRATVEFRTYFTPLGHPDKLQVLREKSRFIKRDGQWLYLSGEIMEDTPLSTKTGRNDPCPCGSQLKYKKCCGA